MQNKIISLSSDDFAQVVSHELADDAGVFVGYLDGSAIATTQDFLDQVSVVFRFPFPSCNVDSFLDWIRDLQWLGTQRYVLVIRDFAHFMSQDQPGLDSIAGALIACVLPWWRGEVERCVVEGRAQQFDIYLVD